jgi:pimeloyl-ACP methyl ester carboxylesterase
MPYARNGEVDVYYETFGNAADPALLLVNGLGSQSINFSDPWCERFVASGFFTIRFDNRDTGLSTKFSAVKPDLSPVVKARAEGKPPPVPYTVVDMAADAIAVLDAVGVARAHVMGFSMGGMIVQTLAIEHPERLHSITSVMSSTGDSDVGQSAPEAHKVLMAPPTTDRDSYIARQIEGIRIWGSPAYFDEDRLRVMWGAAFDRCFCPEGVGRQMMAIIATPSRTPALGDVTVPALVIHGSADKLIDPSGGRRTAEAIPGARFELIDGMGHDYPPELWDRLVQLVTDHAQLADA